MLCETEGSEKALFSRFWLFWRPAGVPTAQTAFCGFCFNLSVFYNFIFCFFHYNLILHNLIFRTAQSLQSFFPALVVCQSLFIFAFKVVPIFLFFCVRPFGHDGSNFALHKLFWLCRQCPAAAVLQTCLYRISAGWITNRCRGGFLLHSVNFVNLFTEQTKKHLLILRS